MKSRNKAVSSYFTVIPIVSDFSSSDKEDGASSAELVACGLKSSCKEQQQSSGDVYLQNIGCRSHQQ
ncbi:unnamed protein product [Ranitomeya imitator]|uniref:Uncharacterized protein n=1 Tax=Ranitomeya imitator TaxID=111125 RepID=A0ABN9MGL6_9NEOB|nr:unnamed protein product [Ranitomeya imitator]